MGIKIPIIYPPSGLACPALGLVDMPPIYLAIFGVHQDDEYGWYWSPNRTYLVQPLSACYWYRYYFDSFGALVKIKILFFPNYTQISIDIHPGGRAQLTFFFYSVGHHFSGPNMNEENWTGGSFQIAFP